MLDGKNTSSQGFLFVLGVESHSHQTKQLSNH
jgi:hypothetical protein